MGENWAWALAGAGLAYKAYKTVSKTGKVASLAISGPTAIATGGLSIVAGIVLTYAAEQIVEHTARNYFANTTTSNSGKENQNSNQHSNNTNQASSASKSGSENQHSNQNSNNTNQSSASSYDGNNDDEDRRKKRKGHYDKKYCQHSENSISSHFKDRFKFYMYLIGLIQKISADTGIPVTEIVQFDRSQYQDQHSKCPNCHAAHLIRLCDINKKLLNNPKYQHWVNALINFGCRTQIVRKFANVYHGPGGYFDRAQTIFGRHFLENFDFTREMTTDDERLLENFKDILVEVLDMFIGPLDFLNTYDYELIAARDDVDNLSNEELYNAGKRGRNGEPFDSSEE